MTQNPAVDLPMTPRDGADCWTVAIDMPVYEDGRDKGRPVGWITTNDRSASKAGGMHEAKRRKLWRQKAYATYLLHRLPKNVGRIHITFQYAFVNNVRPDESNLPPTTKPIIDALMPYRTEIRKGKPVKHEGVGMIRDDKHDVVIGAQQPLAPFLGRGSRVGGRVIVTITPL